MEQTVIKIGNSQGIIIPQKVLASAGIKPGDKVIVEEKNKKITITPQASKDSGVDAKFMKMVDEFVEEHKDVLQALSNR